MSYPYPGPGYPQPNYSYQPAGLPYPPQPIGEFSSYGGAGYLPGMPQPGFPQPSMPQPGFPQPSMPQPGFPQPNMPQPGFPQPTMPQPGYSQPSMPQPAFHQPSYPQTDIPQPGYPQHGIAPSGCHSQAFPQPGPNVYPSAPPLETSSSSVPFSQSGGYAPSGSQYMTPQTNMPSASPQPAAAPARPPPPVYSQQTASSANSYSSAPQVTSAVVDPNLTSYYVCAQKPGDSGTVRPLTSNYNPEMDATQIRNAIKSFTVNDSVLFNILPQRSNAQRQKIRLLYKTMYGRDMLQDLRDKLMGDFESVCAALLMTPAEYDAYQLHKAAEGLGTDEAALIEILCTRTNAQIREMSAFYKAAYKSTLERDMKGETSGHFKRLLISLSNGARLEDQGVNHAKAEADAQRLYKAGEGKWGTDESTFNAVFLSQSFDQLRATFTAYQSLYRKDMEKVIKSEMSGDLEKGMTTIVRFTLDKHGYFANELFKAMKGLGTDEKTLIRILVTRSEIDLENIKRAFTQKGEGKSLAQWIKKETSGSFRETLLRIIGDVHG